MTYTWKLHGNNYETFHNDFSYCILKIQKLYEILKD